MEKLVYYCYKFLLLPAMVLASYSLPAQTKISGIVTGAEGLPMAGVTIGILGTNIATSSAVDGSFSILAKKGDVLFITSVGRVKTTVKLLDQTFLNITLSFDAKSLEEVVVIGYGTAQKKDVTGAVAKISSLDFNTGIITDPLQQVQGKLAGVVLTRPGGDPNGEFTVRIRGATSLEGQPPLVVIDGVAIDDFYKAIATLNPADVESYTVLKDASAAAIYGARGANGVMQITTKSSRSGKTSVDYNGFAAVESVSNQMDVLSADQWRKAAGSGFSGLDKGGNMNWPKVISQTGLSHSHTIGISGGNEGIHFRGSISYTRQEGVIIGTSKEMVTTRVTANHKSFQNRLDVRFGINTSTINRDFFPDQMNTNQSRLGGSWFFITTSGYLPVWPAYNPDGTYFFAPITILNPLFVLNEFHFKQRENFFQSSVKADFSLLEGLKFGALGALSRANDVFDRFVPPVPGTNGTGVGGKAAGNKQNFSGDVHVNYRKGLGKHSIDLTGVYEYNKFINDGFWVMASGFAIPALLNNNLGTATSITTNDIHSFKNEVKLTSFLGRAVYNFNDRYLFTANFRRDGSSKFGPNYRWGDFPSLAFAWRASNEIFMKNWSWLSDLKLRISYGFTGNQENLPPNLYQTVYGPAGSYLNSGQPYQSYIAIQENNPDLKWEVRKSFNIGVDFAILNNRISGAVDVFRDNTDDMLFLYDLPQPPFLNNKVYANAASALNRGIEITLHGAVIEKRNLAWNASLVFARLENQITGLLGKFKGAELSLTNRYYGYAQGGAFGNSYVTRLEIGYPAGVFWIPQYAGLDPDGHELFHNYDTTGKWMGLSRTFEDKDRVFIDPTPDFTWGFTNDFNFKGFDLQFFLRGVHGQKIFANSLLRLENKGYLPRNISPKALTNGFANLPQPSTYWLRDGSFIRLENLTLGYTFGKLKGISKLRTYVTATNLFVITPYDGTDPEIFSEGSQRYIDDNNYPKTRAFTLGVTAVF